MTDSTTAFGWDAKSSTGQMVISCLSFESQSCFFFDYFAQTCMWYVLFFKNKNKSFSFSLSHVRRPSPATHFLGYRKIYVCLLFFGIYIICSCKINTFAHVVLHKHKQLLSFKNI